MNRPSFGSKYSAKSSPLSSSRPARCHQSSMAIGHATIRVCSRSGRDFKSRAVTEACGVHLLNRRTLPTLTARKQKL